MADAQDSCSVRSMDVLAAATHAPTVVFLKRFWRAGYRGRACIDVKYTLTATQLAGREGGGRTWEQGGAPTAGLVRMRDDAVPTKIKITAKCNRPCATDEGRQVFTWRIY